MALRIKQRRRADLVPYAGNPRTHSPEQVAQLAKSIEAFGWTNPILIDEAGGVIAGHGRLLAAELLGIDEVPTITLAGLSDDQRSALVIADNQLALTAGWDMDTLAAELQALSAADFDLASIGIPDHELLALLSRGKGETDPDELPADVEPIAATGDLWLFGDHRLLCGDSTSAADVGRLLAGATPNLMVTDPPYGVNYDPAWRERKFGKGNRAVGTVSNDDRSDWTAAYALHPGDVAYVWHSDPGSAGVAGDLRATGFEIRALMIWGKSHFVVGRGHYHSQHEPCWYAVRKGAGAAWIGGRKQATLWQIDKPQKSESGHGTQKPVECMARPIRNHEGDVYDPFMGSGTTLIAAEMRGRRCYAMEIAPAYVDVAVSRWEQFTGRKATRECR